MKKKKTKYKSRPNPNNPNFQNNQNNPNFQNNQNNPNYQNNQNNPNYQNNPNNPNYQNNQNNPNFQNNPNNPSNKNNTNVQQKNNNNIKRNTTKKPVKKKKFTKKLSELTPKEREVYLKRKERKLQRQVKKVNGNQNTSKNTYPNRKPNQNTSKNTYPNRKPNQNTSKNTYPNRKPNQNTSKNTYPNRKPNKRTNKKSKPKFKFRDSTAYNPKKDPYNPYYQNDGLSMSSTKKKGRKKRYKKNYILYYIILTIFASITLYTLSITVWFEIENITIVGDTNISHEEILQISEIELYENLVKLSRKSVSNKIASAYITIDNVEIHKKYPNAVEIEVNMAKPKALLYYDRLYYTLSESNRIIGYATRNYFDEENLISFIVDDLEGIDLGFYLEEFNEDVLSDVDRLLVAIEENEFNSINYVDTTNISDIKFYASDLYEIKAGGFSEISYKLHCAKSIIDLQLEDDTEKGIIDVSVDNGIYYFRPAVDIGPNITN